MDDATIMWGLGLCGTGFFFLAAWCRGISKYSSSVEISVDKKISALEIGITEKIKDRVTYEWFEKDFKPDLKNNFKLLQSDIKEIRDAIIGTVDKKGLVSKIHEHDDRLQRLEEKIDHGKES